GHVHHQRVAFPVAPRVPLKELNRGSRMGLSVQWNDAIGMESLVKKHYGAFGLKDLKSERCVHLARDARQKTVSLRIFGQMMLHQVFLFGSRPGLIWDLAIGRVYHHSLPRRHFERGFLMFLQVERRKKTAAGPVTLHVGLAIREARERHRRGRGLSTLRG